MPWDRVELNDLPFFHYFTLNIAILDVDVKQLSKKIHQEKYLSNRCSYLALFRLSKMFQSSSFADYVPIKVLKIAPTFFN